MAGRPFPLVDFLAKVGGSLRSPARVRKRGGGGEPPSEAQNSPLLLNRQSLSQSLSQNSEFRTDVDLGTWAPEVVDRIVLQLMEN